MTSQIIFPSEATYWIITNGLTYIDGYTAPNNTTTFGAGTQIYWIGSNYNEYVQQCISVGLSPRNSNMYRPDIRPINTNESEIIVNQLDSLNNKIETLNTVIPGQRISARQARLWLINNGVDLDSILLVIDSIEDPLIRQSVKTEWEYAPYIERDHAWLGQLANILGLSEADLNRAFIEAATI